MPYLKEFKGTRVFRWNELFRALYEVSEPKQPSYSVKTNLVIMAMYGIGQFPRWPMNWLNMQQVVFRFVREFSTGKNCS